jgi:hypothetical protein
MRAASAAARVHPGSFCDILRRYEGGVVALIDPQMQANFEDTLRADVEKVARRTLRHKFGRLSNRRILSILRASADAHAYEGQPDEALLDRWFTEYEAALRRLRAQGAQAG